MARSTKALTFSALTLASALAGCAGSPRGALPPREGAPPSSDLTLVWVGYGEARRLEGGTWKRHPELDYEFTVEQRRYADHWESVKHMRRRHPAYDGSAGPRELTYFFRLDLGATDGGGKVPLRITSTLGPGEGQADREFRTAGLVFHADVSSFAPFDTYRIEQTYAYERGVLEETVSLDKGTTPWVKNDERATLFAARSFAEAPTRR
ncbi:MAG: hypothetical protein JST00_00525 [Deltaproteobacteria bacterium]|nr:hypothetical protein [Deltaproteobacteria bacterium]